MGDRICSACREGPGPQPLQRMGLLKHVPYALCDGARLTTEGVPSPAAGSSKEYPHLGPVARNMAHDTNELLMRIISVRPCPASPLRCDFPCLCSTMHFAMYV